MRLEKSIAQSLKEEKTSSASSVGTFSTPPSVGSADISLRRRESSFCGRRRLEIAAGNTVLRNSTQLTDRITRLTCLRGTEGYARMLKTTRFADG